MKTDENWIRSRLPEECRNEPIDCFAGVYLDGLTVMGEGERGGPDTAVYRAKDEEDLRYWQLERVCHHVGKADHSKTWRWQRKYARDGQWFYAEHRHYDYDAIEDARLPGFELFLKNLHFGFPPEWWKAKVREHVHLINYWYAEPHWDYDRENLRFVEVSHSREFDDRSDPVEEPRPGSVVVILD